jgi:hypothetical protein
MIEHVDIASNLIRRKTTELLLSRRIIEHMESLSMQAHVQDEVFTRLIEVQQRIYAIDVYGESTWAIDYSHLGLLWADLFQALEQLPARNVNPISLTARMKEYQAIELRTRLGVSPCSIDIEVFYSFKPCDVWLMRSVIEDIAKPEVESRSLWHIFDIASEILDDLCDLGEDLSDFNCNRAIIEIAASGKDSAVESYRKLIVFLQCKLRKEVEKCGCRQPICGSLVSWSASALNESGAILRQIQRGYLMRDIKRYATLRAELLGQAQSRYFQNKNGADLVRWRDSNLAYLQACHLGKPSGGLSPVSTAEVGPEREGRETGCQALG